MRPSLKDFTTVISDFNKTTKQKLGPQAATIIVTLSEITAQEPQQNPVFVFSISVRGLLDCFCALVATTINLPSAVEDRADCKTPAVVQGS